jgi:methylmalonyl-CoA mutase
MGAIVGGVDSLVVLPISAVNNDDDEFTRRLAINTQLILKYESHLDYVTDPAGGSYYIENATDKIVEKAWEFFLNIEDQGGFKKAIEDGYIQNQIKEMQKIRINNAKSRKEFLLGVNQYPNPKDFLLEEYKTINLIGDYETKENLKAIQVFRAPIFFEKLRLKTEELSQKKGIPVIQLIPFGNLAMQRARASFIMNFFGCAGFKVEDPGDLKNKEGILNFLKQISNKKIDAFVLCSSDNEYLDMFKEIKNDLLAFKKSVLIAGLPESKEELQNQGIDDFIHIKSNLFETLERYQKLFLENN